MVKNRIDLFNLLPPDAIGVELGVAKGLFSHDILREHPDIKLLYSIDRWTDHHDAEEMLSASRLLSLHGDRSRIIKSTFDRALPFFDDFFFDFIYIDGYAHTGQESGETLDRWWPKLKFGGLFAGHDYHPQFQPTIDAVDAFAKQRGLTSAGTQDDPGPLVFPSWYMAKV